MVGLRQEEDVESQNSEPSGILEEVSDIICPDLTFQQVCDRRGTIVIQWRTMAVRSHVHVLAPTASTYVVHRD